MTVKYYCHGRLVVYVPILFVRSYIIIIMVPVPEQLNVELNYYTHCCCLNSDTSKIIDPAS